jgi:LPS-assembly protein
MFAKNWEDTFYDDNDDKYKRVEGNRLHIKPSLSVPFKNSYAYITPKISLDMVTYSLDNEEKDIRYGGSISNPDTTILTDDSPSRVEPIVSIDSGLFFDRNLTLFDTSLQQTLEPRLFYLYVPEDDQSDIPLFDTGLSSFSFNQLFRENRFTGADRLGDANQMTAALTTRFIDDGSGSELFTASIGQIYYFKDREVTLNYDSNGDPLPDIKYGDRLNNSSSSVAAQVSSRFSRNWYTSYSLLYNPYESGTTDEARYRLQYKADKNHLANIDYSYRAKDYEQIELSTYWKIAPQWQMLAHWYYSLYDFDTSTLAITQQSRADARDGYLLDSKLGIEYDSCCYALRLVVGRDQKNYYAESNNYVMLQVQFKGLGSLTQSLAGRGRSLEQDIPGFEPWKN